MGLEEKGEKQNPRKLVVGKRRNNVEEEKVVGKVLGLKRRNVCNRIRGS